MWVFSEKTKKYTKLKNSLKPKTILTEYNSHPGYQNTSKPTIL